MGAIIGAWIVLGSSLAMGQPSTPAPAAAKALDTNAPVPMKALGRTAIRDRWGVELDGVEVTAGGYMLAFRYQVIDAEKAAPLFVRKTSAGAEGSRRPARCCTCRSARRPERCATRTLPLQGRLYFMVFANPGKFLKRYDLVTITIGDFSVSEHRGQVSGTQDERGRRT